MSEFIPRTMESKGKSIDEAIFRGLQEMGVSIDEVDIETVQEGSKGLLGLGSKPFIVRLTTKPLDLSAVEEAKPQKKRDRRPPREEPRRPEPEANEGGTQPAAGLEAAEAAPMMMKMLLDREMVTTTTGDLQVTAATWVMTRMMELMARMKAWAETAAPLETVAPALELAPVVPAALAVPEVQALLAEAHLAEEAPL